MCIRDRQIRIQNLVNSNAATTKQLDDVNSQLDVLRKQYNATKSSLTISKQGLQSETLPLTAQIEQIEDQIKKSYLSLIHISEPTRPY